MALGVLALAVAEGHAFADAYSEFRIPEHATWDWDATLGMSVFGRAGAIEHAFRSSGLGATTTRWSRINDSGWDRFGAHAELRAFDADEERPRFPFEFTSVTFERRLQHSLRQRYDFWAESNRYFGPRPVFLNGTFSYAGDFFSGRDEQYEESKTYFSPDTIRRSLSIRSRTSRDAHNIRTGIGAGVGRVRDVRGVFGALLLERRLRERGMLTRQLLPATRQRIADLLALATTYESARDRPVRRLWRELEPMLVEDGALAWSGLRAEDVARLREALVGSTLGRGLIVPTDGAERLHGFEVGVRVVFDDSRSWTRTRSDRLETARTDSAYNESRDLGSTGYSGTRDVQFWDGWCEVHVPIGLALQCGARSVVQRAIRPSVPQTWLTSTANVLWTASDRMLVWGGMHHQLVWNEFDDSSDRPRTWSTSLSITSEYFLEDRASVRLSGHQVQERRGGAAASRSFSLELTLRYLFTRRFSTPRFPRLSEAGPDGVRQLD